MYYGGFDAILILNFLHRTRKWVMPHEVFVENVSVHHAEKIVAELDPVGYSGSCRGSSVAYRV
jgi:hypothetical protein